MLKKILFLTGSLELGGIERLTRDLSISLKHTGEWEPAVCCLIRKTGSFLEDLEKESIPVFECSLTRQNMLSFPKRLCKVVKAYAPAIVHSHVDYSIPWQIMGIRKAGVKRIIYTQHSDYQNWKKDYWSRLRIFLYLRLSWPFISAYTAVSKGVQKSVASLAHKKADHFQVIYNPVDVSIFSPDSNKRASARAVIGVGDNQYVIGHVGRFAEAKGHTYLVQAAKIVTKDMPDVIFVLIGDGPLRGLIEHQIEAADLRDHFVLLGRREDVHDLLLGFDQFVMPSLREGLGIALIEALSSGIPSIATTIGGIPEVLENNCGLLIPPADHLALAASIKTLHDQPDLAKKYALAGAEQVIKKFSLSTILPQYIKLYEEVISHG